MSLNISISKYRKPTKDELLNIRYREPYEDEDEAYDDAVEYWERHHR